MKRGHDAALTDHVGGTGDPRAWRRETEDVPGERVAVVDGDEIGEPGVTFRDRIDRNHPQCRPAEPLAALGLEVCADALGHSRWEVSPNVATICLSPSTLTTLTEVK